MPHDNDAEKVNSSKYQLFIWLTETNSNGNTITITQILFLYVIIYAITTLSKQCALIKVAQMHQCVVEDKT